MGQHARSSGRCEVMARKPGGLRNGSPFREWVFPSAMEKVRRKLKLADDGVIVRWCRSLPACRLTAIGAVEAACQGARPWCLTRGGDPQLRTRSRYPAPGALLFIPQALNWPTSRSPTAPAMTVSGGQAAMERTEVLELVGTLKL